MNSVTTITPKTDKSQTIFVCFRLHSIIDQLIPLLSFCWWSADATPLYHTALIFPTEVGLALLG